MRCPRCRKLLVEFLEARLEDKLAWEVREHVSDCAACQRELDDLRSSLRLVSEVKELERIPEPPADFADRVVTQVRQSTGARSNWSVVLGVAAMCIFLVFGAALLSVRYMRTPERQALPSIRDVAASAEIGFDRSSSPPKQVKLPELDANPLYDVKAHIGMELAELLGQTLEVIQRGEQEWEVEI